MRLNGHGAIWVGQLALWRRNVHGVRLIQYSHSDTGNNAHHVCDAFEFGGEAG